MNIIISLSVLFSLPPLTATGNTTATSYITIPPKWEKECHLSNLEVTITRPGRAEAAANTEPGAAACPGDA